MFVPMPISVMKAMSISFICRSVMTAGSLCSVAWEMLIVIVLIVWPSSSYDWGPGCGSMSPSAQRSLIHCDLVGGSGRCRSLGNVVWVGRPGVFGRCVSWACALRLLLQVLDCVM